MKYRCLKSFSLSMDGLSVSRVSAGDVLSLRKAKAAPLVAEGYLRPVDNVGEKLIKNIKSAPHMSVIKESNPA